MPRTWSRRTIAVTCLPLIVSAYAAACASHVEPTEAPWSAPLKQLWENPRDIGTRDLYNGPWGAKHAPDPNVEYTFVRNKETGVNPGVVVTDPQGREWHVKQPPHDHSGAEGPVEVVLSRVLSAAGYHQPPVYFLPSFTMRDGSGSHRVTGGRFRLHESWMKARSEWSWQQNPFVGMRPYQGLLVMLLMFDSSDLKNSNNTLYDVAVGGQTETWYVVRDLGTALGETGRLNPKRSDPDLFARNRFVTDVRGNFVVFDYHGFHQELVSNRIEPGDVGWAASLLAQLSDRQWQDAFRAGGYEPAIASRFIATIHTRIALGQRIGGNDWFAGVGAGASFADLAGHNRPPSE